MRLFRAFHAPRANRPANRRALPLIAAGIGLLLNTHAWSQETFKLGVVTFLSGPAAQGSGTPSAQAARTLLAAFNEGKAPAPYNKPGFGGMKVEMTLIDEAGGAAKQVQELRTLYGREGVDAVVGYIGSGDCLAAAPVAEEMKRLLVLFDCGTPRIFEDNAYSLVFRTAAHSAMDNVALVRYLKAKGVAATGYNLINQDYAFGHDNKKDFSAAMARLYPGAQPGVDLLPKLGAGQYGAEISALSSRPATVTHTSLWGGDLQAFILQAAPRGLFKRTQLVIPAGDHVLPSLGERMPDGVILGARGRIGKLAAKSPLNDWWVQLYSQAHKAPPLQSEYRMAQALMGLKLAIEKAMAANGGRKPTTEQIANALRHAQWETPGGTIRMALGKGQQAVQDTAIGRTRFNPATKAVDVVDQIAFPAECVNPPEDMRAEDWIKAGYPGARNCP